MATAVSSPVGTLDIVRSMSSRSRAVLLLQVFAVTLFVVPSDTVIKPIGAGGYLAALVGMFGFAAFLTVTLLGLHNPLRQRHPIRGALCLLWLSVLAFVRIDGPERADRARAGGRRPSIDAAGRDHGGGADRGRLPPLARATCAGS